MSDEHMPLSDMIRGAKASRTYDELAEHAFDPSTGTTMSGSNLNKIALGQTKRIPTPGQLIAIATALNIKVDTVRKAALEQYMAPDRFKQLAEQADTALKKAAAIKDAAETARARLDGTSEPRPKSA